MIYAEGGSLKRTDTDDSVNAENSGSLSHLRVLDLSRVLAGPWAGQALADLGADVIKVERRGAGDDTRHWGPPFVIRSDGERGDAAYFTAANRNKKSLAIDFSTEDGARIVKMLAARADVLIENFQVGRLAKHGLDYQSLSSENPGLVYCSITGFGQNGPYAHRAGYDFMIQGMGGLMSITGMPDGTPGAGPVKVGVAVSDLFTGMYGVVSILAALAHRQKTGRGQHIDCSLFDSQVAMLANQGANWLIGDTEPARMGNRHPNIAPYTMYPVKDGHVIVTCGNDEQFSRLCGVIDCGEAAQDPRFATNADRVANRADLDDLLGARLMAFKRDDVIARLEAANVPCGPVNTVREVFEDPHVRARRLVVDAPNDEGEATPTVAFPVKFSETSPRCHSAPPALGAHTEKILQGELGFSDARIADLRRRGVI